MGVLLQILKLWGMREPFPGAKTNKEEHWTGIVEDLFSYLSLSFEYRQSMATFRTHRTVKEGTFEWVVVLFSQWSRGAVSERVGKGRGPGDRHDMTRQHEVDDRTSIIGSQLVSGGREADVGGCLVAVSCRRAAGRGWGRAVGDGGAEPGGGAWLEPWRLMEEEVNRCPQAGRLADAVGRVVEGQVGVQDPLWEGGGGKEVVSSHREAPCRAAQTQLTVTCTSVIFFITSPNQTVTLKKINK